MEKTFTYKELIEICESVRVTSQTQKDVRTMDIVIDTLVERGTLFRVQIYLCNDNSFTPTKKDTIEFWDEESAKSYVEGFNEKHNWIKEGCDYLFARLI